VAIGASQIGGLLHLERFDDWAIEVLLRVGGGHSPVAFELCPFAGPAAARRRAVPGPAFLLLARAVPETPAPAAELKDHRDRCFAALAPWAASASRAY
jgi:hypothetical protein